MPAQIPPRTESEVRAKLSDLLFCMTCRMFSGCGFAGDAAVRTIVEELFGLFDLFAFTFECRFSPDFFADLTEVGCWKIVLFIGGKFWALPYSDE